jgi:hypothetical protein
MEVLVKRKKRICKDKEKKGDATTDNVTKFETQKKTRRKKPENQMKE